MELIDRGFSQKIAGKYTNVKLFSTNFAPIISTKRVIPHRKWLELVYAMPYLVLRREILNSFKRTMNVFASAKQIWNILVHLDFPLSQHREKMKMRDTRYKMQVKQVSDIRYPVSSSYVNLVDSRGFYFESSSMELAKLVSHETTRKETESAFTNYRLPIVTQQPPVVSHTPSAVSYRNRDISILSGTIDFIAPIFRSYSFKPTSFLSQQTVPNEHLQKSDTALHPYGHLERVVLPNGQAIFSFFESSSMELAQPVSHETTRKETESAFSNYPLPLVTQQPPVVSHTPSAISYRNQDISILSGTSDFIAPIFRSYSFKPTSFLSQKTVPNERLQKSDTVLPPYGHLERVVLPNGQAIFSFFESSSMELAQPVSHETTRKETESAFSNYPLPLVTQQPPVVSHTPSAISYRNQDISILSGTSDFIAPIFRSYSFKPTSFLSQQTGPEKQQEVSLNLQKSEMEITHPLSHETSTAQAGRELAFENYQLPLVSHTPSAVSNNNLVTYIPSGTSDFINRSSFNIINKKNEQMQLGIKKAPIYHTYPKIEHVTATHTEIIRERVIEKKEDIKPLHATPQLPSIDLNRLTDQVYQMLERKVRIERERRGLLCR